MLRLGNAPHSATHVVPRDWELRKEAGIVLRRREPLVSHDASVCTRAGFTSLTPEEFFKPNWFRASTEVRRSEGLWAANTLGPLRAASKGDPVVTAPTRGDQETR